MADISRPKTRNKETKREAYRRTASFDQDQYEAQKSSIAILMGHFLLRYLNLIYKEFDGDLVLPIVLGEIAHHNLFKFYSLKGQCIDFQEQMVADPDWQKGLEPCNAFSISEATGIPRETVRRKIDKLLNRGWLVKNARGEVTITDKVGDHFMPDFNMILITELLDTSECINRLLESDKGPVK